MHIALPSFFIFHPLLPPAHMYTWSNSPPVSLGGANEFTSHIYKF